MQEIKKRRIVIASVLKPVNDTRMFEKLGLSLASIAEVHIVGYPGEINEPVPLTVHPLQTFTRLSLTRLMMPWKVFSIIRKLNPHDVIITTHELIVPAMLLRLIRGTRVIYDVQENYFRNILYTDAFPRWLRPFVATYVRLKELILSPLVSTFILAEKAYCDELRFVRSRHVILENKFRESRFPDRLPRQPVRGIHLVFTGTLSKSTGVLNAIDLAIRLHEAEPAVKLTIAGYCPRRETFNEISRLIEGRSFIHLTGGDRLVPHNEILKFLATADAGIVAYEITPATTGSTPTKLYEYAAFGLPVLVVPHEPWVDWLARNASAIVFDPDRPDVDRILAAIKKQSEPRIPDRAVFWESDESKLLDLFRNHK